MANSKPAAVSKGDMTQGSIYKTLTVFSIPILLTNILNQLYNTADSVIVGRFCGADALAAVAANGFISMLLVSIFIGAGMGGGVLVAQLMGARKYDEISRAFNTMYTLIASLAAVAGVLAIIFAEPLMRMLNTPENIFDDAVLYFRITSAAMPGMGVYASGSSALRSVGDSKAPLYFLIFSAIMNVALNILFVVAFDMAVAGVAWATLIAQYASALLVLVRTKTCKMVKINVSFKTLGIHWPTAGIIMKLGIPSALQTCVTSLGMVLVQRYTNVFGSDAIAASSAVMKLDGFLMMPVQAVSQALVIFFGQNLAAKKQERLHKGTLFGVVVSVAMSLVLTLVLVVFAEPLVRMFTDSETVIELGKLAINVLAWNYWLMALYNVFGGIMRGAGDTMTVMVVSLIGTILRVPLTWAMCIRPEPDVYVGQFWAMLICNVVMSALIVAYYFTGRWKKKVVVTIDD